MRSRKQICEDVYASPTAADNTLNAMYLQTSLLRANLEVLLDIRDLLMQAQTAGTGRPDAETIKDGGDGNPI